MIINHVPVQQLFSDLFVWLNKNKPLKKGKKITEQDVAHITLTESEFAMVPAETTYCTWKRTWIKHYNGIEIRQSLFDMPPINTVEILSTRIAWKITGNTVAIFKMSEENDND